MTKDHEVACFFAGIAIGATAAALFVPKSGPQTRKFLQENAESGADYLKDRYGEFATAATDAVERGARTFRNQTESVAAAVSAACDTYREAVETAPGSSS